MKMGKEYSDIVDRVLADGDFTLLDGTSNHPAIKHVSGEVLRIPGTPSDKRGPLNFQADIARVRREHHQSQLPQELSMSYTFPVVVEVVGRVTEAAMLQVRAAIGKALQEGVDVMPRKVDNILKSSGLQKEVLVDYKLGSPDEISF
jgi:hypothetical protein